MKTDRLGNVKWQRKGEKEGSRGLKIIVDREMMRKLKAKEEIEKEMIR